MIGTKFLKSEEWWRRLARVGLGALLLLPYFIWLIQISEWGWPEQQDWIEAIQYSIVQSTLSAILSLSAGFALFLAFQNWSIKYGRTWIEGALLFPNLIPPLFVAMSLLAWTGVLGRFPFGMGAVVLAHVLINSGLVAVALDRIARVKLARLSEAAWTMGVSQKGFWQKVAWPLMKRDVYSLFLFVFSLSLTSFSLPLLLSGDRVVTLEIAIYDAIRVDGRWDVAVLLAALQSVFMFALAWLLPAPLWTPSARRSFLPYSQNLLSPFWVLAPGALLLVGWLLGWSFALSNLNFVNALKEVFAEAIAATLILGLLVGFWHLVLFLLVALVSPHAGLDRFLNGYLAPSPAITGFGLLLLPVEGDLINLLKVSVALTLITFPLLYRWLVHAALSELRSQVSVARTLGARWSLILTDVVWPQAAPMLLRAAGLAALWACGDFALSGILLNEAPTLPLLMDDLMSRYQWEAAQLLLFPLSVVALSVYFIFTKALRYVVG